MRILVVGGKLQGLEICYLAKKANYTIGLIDKNQECLAKNFCDKYYCINILEGNSNLKDIVRLYDIVIPAIENSLVLNKLESICKVYNIKFLYDSHAYGISSSKIKSDILFRKIKLAVPKIYPKCKYPILVKPSGLSGSKGVRIIYSPYELKEFVVDDSWVIQEYLEGKSYSIEIIGINGIYKTFQVTEIIVDEVFDCKKVVAYTDLTKDLIKSFQDIAYKIAKEINLNGIMDVEVILNKGKLKVLEIDARFPSQTPITIYQSTGQNMLEYLCTGKTERYNKEKGVIFEHIKLKNNLLKVAGEHIMSDQNNLELIKNFFGADEAITNFNHNSKEWVATLIIVDSTIEKAEEKKVGVINNILNTFGIKLYQDLIPVVCEEVCAKRG